MIVRTWHGRTRLSDGDEYEAFMKERAAPDYRSVAGLEKLFFTRRNEGDRTGHTIQNATVRLVFGDA